MSFVQNRIDCLGGTVEVQGEESSAAPWVPAFPGGLGALVPIAEVTGVHRLASGGSDHTIRIWDLRTGTVDGEPLVGHTTAVWALTSWTTAGGGRLASSAEDERICIWNLETREQIGVLTGHAGWISTLASWAGPNGPRIASGGFDATIRVWDPDTGAQVYAPLTGHDGPVLRLFHWIDGNGVNCLASTGDDGMLRLWDADRGQPIGMPFASASAATWGLAGWTTPHGHTQLASAGTDGKIQIWDPLTGNPVGAPIEAHSGTIGAMTAWIGPDGPRIASLGADGTIRFWNPDTGEETALAVQGTSGWLPTIASWVEPDGAVKLACGGAGGSIHVWDFSTGADVVEPLVGHTSSMWTLAVWRSADGSARLAAAGDDATVRIWNADTGTSAGRPLAGHTAGIWALSAWQARDGVTRLASAGDDATIRIWDVDTGTTVGEPIAGHVGWITALETWTDDDDRTVLVSAGIDGTVRRWHAGSGDPFGEPLSAGDGRVLALAIAETADGRRLIASGGTANVLHVWDAETGEQVVPPLSGHKSTIRSVTGWTSADGQVRFATASFDGTARIWDVMNGTCLHTLAGHTGQVAKAVVWADASGRELLATGGDDGSVRVWDAATGAAIREPLTGHSAGIWALAPFSTAGGRDLLASTGEDGTIRLWDPVEGTEILTVEVGEITLWGLSDMPTRLDALGREALVRALTDQLLQPANDGGPGPAVVSVEGPWGSGKTTFMQSVRRRIAQLGPAPAGAQRPLTVREAREQIKHAIGEPVTTATSAARAPAATASAAHGKKFVTAWFNPWVYESGEQIWAGLLREIIEAAALVLFPDDAGRERYWFRRNVRRVDAFALRRVLTFRILSPVFGVAAVAVVAPIIVGVAQLGRQAVVSGIPLTGIDIALGIAAAFLLIGVAHTVMRYLWSPVAQYLPAAMLYRPLADGVSITTSRGTDVLVPDPQQRALAGQLFLHQSDIAELLSDLNATGCQMVIFIDDIDRCRMATIVEVFEAINTLLLGVVSREDAGARFVIGLDPAVIAAQLSMAMTAGSGTPAGADNADLGWTYLRKFVQLPVVLPRISDASIDRFIDTAIGPPAGSAAVPSGNTVGRRSPARRGDFSASRDGAGPAVGPTTTAVAALDPRPIRPRGTASATLAWRSLEQHPLVRAFLADRLKEQPHRSIRDVKRLINVWQLYERLLEATRPEPNTQERIARSENLLLLAEIVTRWPGLLPALNRAHPQGRGLGVLALAAGDDKQWTDAVRAAFADVPIGTRDLAGLRSILAGSNGQSVVSLATELM